MKTIKRGPHLLLYYEEHAQEYLRNLPPEHFMESTPQATQRKITLESFDLVQARRPDVHVFNELLVQYPRPRHHRPGQVVPDNMVVLSEKRIKAISNYAVELEPARPFWMFEYVSKTNARKDYVKSFRKYEQELKVPYYLVFYPDNQELTLFRLKDGKYVSVPSNEDGRHPVPELEMEVALLDGWVRYWYEGRLLPLPAELDAELEKARRAAQESERQARREKQRADSERQRADEAERRATEAERRADAEREARRALEEELARLRAKAP